MSDNELTAEMMDATGTWTVADTSGNRWWPGPCAMLTIEAAAFPASEAIRLCQETGTGVWK